MVLTRAQRTLADVTLEGFTVSFAAGYACFPTDARDAGTLLQAAGGAVRVAQKSGAGSTRRYDPPRSRSSTTRRLATKSSRSWSPGWDHSVFQPLSRVVHRARSRGNEGAHALPPAAEAIPDEWFNLARARGDGRRAEAAASGRRWPCRTSAGHVPVTEPQPIDATAPEVEAVLRRI